MVNYRLYRVDGKGRFQGFDEIEAETDEEAVKAAFELKVTSRSELWERARIIAELPPYRPEA